MAVECRDVTWSDTSFTICEVDATTEDLRLFHRDPSGKFYGDFKTIEITHDLTLSFAMNAGMYHDDHSPVGLYQQDGEVTSNIVLSDGPGNFGLLPNGVLCLGDSFARVMESHAYAPDACRDATQSGPMLVIDGALHPRFIDGGTSRKIRNGVGTSADGTTAYFAIANDPVNFHTFGRLFRDHIGVGNALYLDGTISRLHAPQLSRSDWGVRLGPIVGVVD